MKWFFIICCVVCLGCVDEQAVEDIIPHGVFFTQIDTNVVNNFQFQYIHNMHLKFNFRLKKMSLYLDSAKIQPYKLSIEGYGCYSNQKGFQICSFLDYEHKSLDPFTLTFHHLFDSYTPGVLVYYSFAYRWQLSTPGSPSGIDTIGIIGVRLR